MRNPVIGRLRFAPHEKGGAGGPAAGRRAGARIRCVVRDRVRGGRGDGGGSRPDGEEADDAPYPARAVGLDAGRAGENLDGLALGDREFDDGRVVPVRRGERALYRLEFRAFRQVRIRIADRQAVDRDIAARAAVSALARLALRADKAHALAPRSARFRAIDVPSGRVYVKIAVLAKL